MSSYFQNNTKEPLFTIKQAAERLKLNYGRNTFFKKLKEWGYLKHDNNPAYFMIENNLMIIREKQLSKGGSRMQIYNVPMFTQKGLWFIYNKIEELRLAKS